jgi:hypothetical protein
MHIDEGFFLAKYFLSSMRVREEDIAALATKTETLIPKYWLMYNAVAMKALRNDDQFVCAAKRFDMLDRRQCIARPLMSKIIAFGGTPSFTNASCVTRGSW